MRDPLPLAGRRMVIVHGYTASPDANWFPWLAERLRSDGARVDVPAMPDSHAPQPDAWAGALHDLLPVADADTWLIGHSLGCIAVMRHLLSLPAGTRIGGLLLVSGFDRPLPTLPELAAFTRSPPDHARLRERARRRFSLFSDNDAIVDPQASRDLATALDSDVDVIRGGGHFLDREGFVQFPPAHAVLRRLAGRG